MSKRLKDGYKEIPGPMAHTLQVQWADGTWTDEHFNTESEARAFVLAVYTYHQTGIGEDWHGEVFRIVPRPFLGSQN